MHIHCNNYRQQHVRMYVPPTLSSTGAESPVNNNEDA